MTRDDIIRMAEYACIFTNKTSGELHGYKHSLERFAALVAAAEREACAKVCEEEADRVAEHCALAIRQRRKE